MTGSGKQLVSVVVPTRNEAGNVGPLVRRIQESAEGVVAEVIFVDDSDDKTPSVVERVASSDETRITVRLIHREADRRNGGLGGAVMEGIDAARSDWILVMDGDLQHPPEVIPDMVALAEGDVRLVVASRRKDEGRPANSGPFRRFVTSTTTLLTKGLFPLRLAGITDPLTGFFLVDRRALPDDLQPDGFKILLEILARGTDLNPVEYGFGFGDRVSGRSKATYQEGVRLVKLLARLRLSTRSTRRQMSVAAEKKPTLKYRYDIHGVITLASEARLPELKWFQTDKAIANPDIAVRIGKPTDDQPDAMEYREVFGWAGFAVRVAKNERVEINASRLVGWSPHVLYTNVVEPVLRWQFAQRGHALVHTACVVKDGLAYLVTARTDTGKTTTALKLLEGRDLEFLSDDLSLVSPEGELLTYPKPMTMSYHTVKAVNPDALTAGEKVALQPQSRLHSRSGRRIGLGLAKSAFPAATANAIAQMIIPPPKYPVQRILPGTRTATSGVPVHLFVIARGPESKRRLSGEESAEMLLANCEDAYGFPPYEQLESYLLDTRNGDLRAAESGTILNALVDCPATLLQSETYGWADSIKLEIEADVAMRRADRIERDASNGSHLVIDLTDARDSEAVENVGVGGEKPIDAAG